MRSQRYTLVLPMVLLFVGGASARTQNPVYTTPTIKQSATVTIMALSTSVHHGFAGNQEIYLADIELKGKGHQVAKLVDSYSPSGPQIRRSILIEHHPLRMTLVRDADCDTTGQRFFLGTDEANIFDAATRDALKDHATEPIPCFNVIHEATRLAK
jgi:hypothetical protein